LQCGGASGNGFVGSKRLHEAMEEMKAFGAFEKGMFTRKGETRSQDSFEAIWEHVNGRELVYPRARYGEAILIKPQNFEWEPQSAQPGFARKRLCIFSERHLQLDMLKIDPGARAAQPARGGVQVGFVMQGEGEVNGEALRKYSAFSGKDEFTLA